jgi:hypothetical protein
MTAKGNEPSLSNRRAPRKPASVPDSAEVVPSTPATPSSSEFGISTWQPPSVVKVTTQMTVEHRQLLHRLEAQTGEKLWVLLGKAIENTYENGQP